MSAAGCVGGRKFSLESLEFETFTGSLSGDAKSSVMLSVKLGKKAVAVNFC